jgi:hypothetical protein
MTELITFLDYSDTSIFGKLFNSLGSGKRIYAETENLLQTQQDTATVTSADFLKIQELLLEFQQTRERIKEVTEFDIPEVFDLRPLSSQRITLNIRETKSASFYFVAESDDTEE